MANSFVNVRLDSFFDEPKILRLMDRKEQKVLSGAGAFGRQSVRRSIRKAPKRKQVTSGPPRFHVRGRESLKDRIFFSYDRQSGTVVVGPELFNARGAGRRGSVAYRLIGARTVPELLEKGGERVVLGRRSEKRKPIRQKYKSRPYVGPETPAFKATAAKLADLMRTVDL